MKTIIILTCAIFAATAAPLNLNEICRGILFAALPHPDDQNLFIGCVQGRGTIMGCNEEDDIFDPVSVSCKNRHISTTRSPIQEICDDKGQGLFPSDDCRDYIVCEATGNNVRRCPDYSIFDPALPGCVYGNTTTCEIYAPVTTPAPTQPPITTVPTTIPTTAPPTDTPTTIPPTTIPPTTIPPTTTPPSTQAPTVPTTPSVTDTTPTGPPSINFNCPVEGYGNIPHLTYCERYFECVRGVRYAKTCPEGQIFDIINKRCDLPENSICARDVQCFN